MSETNGYATPDLLFGSPVKRRFADVQVEGLGKFRIRSLTDLEKSSYDAAAINKDGKFNRMAAVSANARICVLCCVDGEGNPIFCDEHIGKLQELDAGALGELADECRRHCGFVEIDEAAKN